MNDLWIIYNASYDYPSNSATRMLDCAKANDIDACLMFSDYFSFNDEMMLYKDKELKEFPNLIFYRGRDEKLIIEFEQRGIKVINSSFTTIICKDKYKTHALASTIGINQPKTVLLENKSYEYYLNIFNNRFLLKNRYGAQGKDIYLINNKEEYLNVISSINIDDYIAQEFVEFSSGRDIRVYIVGNKIVGAMERKNEGSFLANIAKGGLSYDFILDEDTKKSALALAKKLMGDIISVDYLFSENGLIFCEANTNAGFASFIYLGYNMRDIMMKYLKELLKNK